MTLRKATQKDVARRAGVSVATVSYVLNNLDGGNVRISDETRQRVLLTMQEMGYIPNLSARSLSTSRTQLIAVLIPDITDSFFTMNIRGIQSVVIDEGYDLLVYDCEWRNDRENDFVNAIQRRRVDGIILNSIYTSKKSLEALLANNQNVVVVGNNPDLCLPGVDIVGDDEYEGVLAGIRYLASKGHQRIGHISGPLDTPSGMARYQGYRDGLKETGIPFIEELICHARNFSGKGLEEILCSTWIKDRSSIPSAIFAANDHLALAAIRSFRSHGIGVPEDIEILGFDDIPEANLVSPTLTTISHDPQNMGKLAAELLLERINFNGPLPSRIIRSSCKLVRRESA